MSLNYQKARDLMVENQLRPNKIKDPVLLKLFRDIPKEDFLPNKIKAIPYSDMDIDLNSKRGYLKNLHIAQLIKYAEIKKNHKILHLGAMTGYVTSLLSCLCLKIIAIESDEKFFMKLQNNIDNLDANNIKIVKESLNHGFNSEAPYDIVFIDTPIKSFNKKILKQLNKNLGKIIMIEKVNDNLSKAVKITNNDNSFSKEFLFDVFSKYELFDHKKEFIF